MYFTETDHLGSIIALLRTDGILREEYSHDPWGRRRNPVDWSYNNVSTTFLIDRGFTGHEHLDMFGLINMNGRIYDPVLGRFLSVDPVTTLLSTSIRVVIYGKNKWQKIKEFLSGYPKTNLNEAGGSW
jgi:RHS repeat-associated protein